MKKKVFTEKRIETIIRFWFTGAVFFFIGWGTGIAQASIYDYVFFLGLSIAIVEMFIVGPVIRLALNVEGTNRNKEKNVFKRVIKRLGHILQAIFLVALVATVYTIINQSIVGLFGLPVETVVLPAEPILFGILYVTFFRLLESLKKNFKQKLNEDNKREKYWEGEANVSSR